MKVAYLSQEVEECQGALEKKKQEVQELTERAEGAEEELREREQELEQVREESRLEIERLRLELAHSEATKQHMVISAADLAAELSATSDPLASSREEVCARAAEL